jgi:hypothetical protein
VVPSDEPGPGLLEIHLLTRPLRTLEDLTALQVVEASDRFADPLPQLLVGGIFGQAAGCNANLPYGPEGWAASGTPAGNQESGCTLSLHNHAIAFTGLQCDLEACSVDALDWTNDDFLFVECEAGSRALVDWQNNEIILFTGHCHGFVEGASPTGYGTWDSLGQRGQWSHTDNLPDAIHHLVAPGLPPV